MNNLVRKLRRFLGGYIILAPAEIEELENYFKHWEEAEYDYRQHQQWDDIDEMLIAKVAVLLGDFEKLAPIEFRRVVELATDIKTGEKKVNHELHTLVKEYYRKYVIEK